MRLQTAPPDILQRWTRFIDIHDHLSEVVGPTLESPSLELLIALAGALVASATGGVADPHAGGSLVIAPDGDEVTVAVASFEHGPGMGMLFDAQESSAAWVALVAFQGFRPVALHLIPARRIEGLCDAVNLHGRGTYRPPDTPIVLSTMLHWEISLEPLLADLYGVQTCLLGGAERGPGDRV